ncbi:MAG: HlyD family type I secretion periplasmic adaptor subunit [Parvularculaceae bacterium]
MTLAIASDIDNELPIEPSKAAQYLLYAIAALLIVFFCWAALAKLDRVTRGQGRVVPSNHLQKVQYLEGGIIKDILVRPGEIVKKGAVLVRVDPTQINAQFAQGRDDYNLAAARLVRLQAMASKSALVFPEELARAAPDIVANEKGLFEARGKEFNSALAVEQGKIEDAKAALDYSTRTYDLAKQELAILKPLVDDGVEPRINLLRAEQRAASALGEKQRAEIAVKSAASEIERIKSTYQASIADDIAKTKAEFSGVDVALPALRDKVDRTDLRSPIDGVVHRVLVTTVGGVVQPGQTIVEVVPEGDSPLVEAKIKPSDVGFLRVGQEARVKISAYDSSVYGSISGTIETISPDAIEDEKTGTQYFLITVRVNAEEFETRNGALAILPGMAAEVDMLNGKRSVLAYLMKPLADLSTNALQDK